VDTIATLAAGASATFTVTMHVNASVPDGTLLRNTATVSSGTTDPIPGNDTSTATSTVNARADLAVIKTGPATIIAGTDVTYTISVSNNGPSDAQGVALADALPAGTTLVSQAQTAGPAFALSSSGSAVRDTIATLAAGASATF